LNWASFYPVNRADAEVSMFQAILNWTVVVGAVVAPFLVGVVLEHRLYPIERQWATRLGR
jgi:hypothetical protein